MSPSLIPLPHEQSLPQGENAFRFLLLLSLLFASFLLADTVMHHSSLPVWTAWMAVLLLAIGNGVLLIGFGVLAHEAVHRVLFRSAFWNECIGGVAAALMLTPFCANRQFHLTHHAYAHQPELDPENRMHHRSFGQAMTVGSLMGLWLQYRIMLRNAVRKESRYRWRLLKDIACLSVAGMVFAGFPLVFGIDWQITSALTILVFPLVFAFRALSDHYGLPAVKRKSQQMQTVEDGVAWQREVDAGQVTGWVIMTAPWLEWLWSHVNYHEVHHKYPWLAHSHLPAAYQATCNTVPYRVVRGYWQSLFQNCSRSYYERS